MDPKGDRLRKIQMGTLKLPESVLRSNNIVLTPEPLKLGGGCLEGGARPRPVTVTGKEKLASGETKLVIGSDGSLRTVDMSVIPLPNDADIPLPKDLVPETDIPLPKPLSSENIPLPKDSDIPLPPDDLIPLPADKPSPQPEKKKKVLLTRLEPTGDELLCRSCEMKFLKQVDYDTHLQTESHQQAIEADLKEGRSHGIGLLIPRQTKKSPSHDGKSGHVSFSFKKNIGSRITNAQPFHRNEQRISPEIKILKLEGENQNDKGEISRDGTNSQTGTEKVLGSMKGLDVNESKLLCSFVKVQSKDDSGRVLDWPKEMIQYTQTEPKITYSCNPLCFDFSQLFGIKSKKSPIQANVINEKEGDEGETQGSGLLITDENIEKKGDSEKKRSHKKKKKKKHKKHKDKTDDKETNEGDNKEGSAENKAPEVEGKPDAVEGETASSKKKKKKKHKKKDKDISTAKEGEEDKEKTAEDGVDIADKDKKKHKKSKKRKHQSEAEDENKTGGDEEKKSKKRKKSKKSKKRKRKHQSDKENEKSEGETEKKSEVKKTGENTDTSGDETDAEKDKEGKRKQKKKKKKSKKKEGGNESSDEETTDKTGDKPCDKPENTEKTTVKVTNNISIKKNLGTDTEHDKIVAKLQAIKSSKQNPLLNAVNPLSNAAQIKKVLKPEIIDKKTLIDRKRVNSESSVSESTPSNVKKSKVTPKTLSGLIDNTNLVGHIAVANVKVEKEDSWVKIENQTTDNVKSKWDTSESDMENALDENTKTKKKITKVTTLKRKTVQAKRELKSQHQPKLHPKNEIDAKKSVNPSLSQRSNKSNVSAGSAKKQASAVKTRKKSPSPASSRSSRSRSRSYSHRRSYSRSSSRSRSHSYSSSSSYSSGYSHSRHRRRHSSSRSYSRSRSRSRSRSYRRGRARSSSYSSSYSRSSYSRSRSRSHRRRKRRRSYSRSRSYSSSSYSSRSRSRSRSYRRKSRRKAKRRTKHKQQKPQKPVPVTTNEKELSATIKTPAEKEPVKEPNVDPSDIPLPDLSGKKEDEKSEEKLAKLKEKKPRTDVGQTVAKLVESLPSDIPLPFSENSVNTVSSDALPSSPPTTATKESETGFIGPKLPNSNMAPPPPPPPGHLRFPNHGPPGPPHPGFRPNQWDHWGPGPWDGPGHWDGPGPGPRPYRGMRPPFDPRMAGPFDPRMRRPPPFMNRHGPMHMGPRYPGPHGPPHDYEYEYEYPQEYDPQYTEDEPPKNESPPPLPPPKNPSPKPPPPEKKEKEIKEPEQNPSIVIPPEQAEQYKHLQKQAAKHARRQRRRQQKKELGEPEEDSSSSDSEPEQQEVQATEMVEDEQQILLDEMQPQLMTIPQQVMLAQPQPASSPAGYVVAVSNGQQILLQKQPSFVQAGIPVQAGQPVMISQGANAAMLAAAASGAQPAHIVQQVPSGLAGVQHGQVLTQAHIPQGIQLIHSSASLQQLQQIQHIQQIQQAQQIQQIQQIQHAHAIQAHNQAVQAAHAAQHTGPIIVGNQILVPRIGMRPAM